MKKPSLILAGLLFGSSVAYADLAPDPVTAGVGLAALLALGAVVLLVVLGALAALYLIVRKLKGKKNNEKKKKGGKRR